MIIDEDLRNYVWSLTGSDLNDDQLYDLIENDTSNAGRNLSSFEINLLVEEVRKAERS